MIVKYDIFKVGEIGGFFVLVKWGGDDYFLISLRFLCIYIVEYY